jgi:hypothetical protein
MASTKRSALAVNATVDLTTMNTEIFINYKSFEQQAASNKRQAPSDSSFEQQAPSSKPQAKASSSEQQAPSPEQRASSSKPRASS